eukprot:CAMPEP_0185773924 /NCGR_PEP_ID=MMETSP1174-20130828/75714_1 /TAXON_ID=35687 /ORGANISM="Dictyocha speculum, Strain CCMP1381" /LENGTH=36 /DNA_ID= /DNA_START= /DNA_END= /DNA_ORIENTATION=
MASEHTELVARRLVEEHDNGAYAARKDAPAIAGEDG